MTRLASNAELPSSKEGWLRNAKRLGVADKSIHKLVGTASASKMPETQVYALRALWVVHRSTDVVTKFITQNNMDWAQNKLSKNESWKNYTKAITNGRTRCEASYRDLLDSLGVFSMVHLHQDSIIRPDGQHQSHDDLDIDFDSANPKIESVSKGAQRRTRTDPSKADGPMSSPLFAKNSLNFANLSIHQSPDSGLEEPETPMGQIDMHVTSQLEDIEESPLVNTILRSPDSPERKKAKYDEAIVETALLAFLQAITTRFLFNQPQATVGEWSRQHLRLHCGSWIAITDGMLKTTRKSIKAIVEVKPFSRTIDTSLIRAQEAGQMAAWICSDPLEGTPSIGNSRTKW